MWIWFDLRRKLQTSQLISFLFLEGTKGDDEDEEGMEDKIKECEELNEEAQLPLVDLLAKYKQKC